MPGKKIKKIKITIDNKCDICYYNYRGENNYSRKSRLTRERKKNGKSNKIIRLHRRTLKTI